MGSCSTAVPLDRLISHGLQWRCAPACHEDIEDTTAHNETTQPSAPALDNLRSEMAALGEIAGLRVQRHLGMCVCMMHQMPLAAILRSC